MTAPGRLLREGSGAVMEAETEDETEDVREVWREFWMVEEIPLKVR